MPRFVAAAVIAVCLVSTGYWWAGQSQPFSAEAQTSQPQLVPASKTSVPTSAARQYHRSNPSNHLHRKTRGQHTSSGPTISKENFVSHIFTALRRDSRR